MKKIAIKIGGAIATIFMLSPIYIILNYENIESYYVWLIISIFYDIYMYSIISKEN